MPPLPADSDSDDDDDVPLSQRAVEPPPAPARHAVSFEARAGNTYTFVSDREDGKHLLWLEDGCVTIWRVE